MSPKNQESAKKKPGCFRSFLALALVVVIVGFAVSMMGGDPDTVDTDTGGTDTVDPDTFSVESEVLIMQDANFVISGETCSGVGAFEGVSGGATVTITADDGDQVTAQLAEGVLSPEGNCLLAFTVELSGSDTYEISVGNQEQSKSANTIGTNDDGTRWMSVQFD